MSHELRTPLNAILGFSEVMKGELLGPINNGSYKEYAANIHDSGRHLLQLINEILDLSRIEAGRYELNEEPVQARRRRRGLPAPAEPARGEQGARRGPCLLTGAWSPCGPTRAPCARICLNLISNALKFTPRGGHVTVTVAHTPEGGQMLVVKDTGPGIPKEEIPRVMQAFGQGSLAHQVAEGGTGLGLPIVQSLVAAHGGTFELRSVLRKGTEAIVRLPPSRLLRAAALRPPPRRCEWRGRPRAGPAGPGQEGRAMVAGESGQGDRSTRLRAVEPCQGGRIAVRDAPACARPMPQPWVAVVLRHAPRSRTIRARRRLRLEDIARWSR